ncbi:CHAT domain-containing protein [Leptothoe sp. LEGE 181152]|nr:CHAT domain-containing protein [Leptothoe sp. LEGE 181152]
MRFWSIGLISGLMGVTPVMAQSIVPTDMTQVEQRANEYSITGGQQSADGLNLFHGFESFNLDEAERASFWVPAGVANVLGRISGGDASLINGQLQLLGSNADLFLLNPAGIIFGERATLALPGSFLATTADGVTFDNGTFPVLGSVDYGLLVGEPTGLEFWAGAAGIILNSSDLTVDPEASLSLVGSSVTNTGDLSGTSGSITLAAVPDSHYVRLSSAGSVLSYDLAAQHIISGFNPLDLPTLLTDVSVASATGLVVNADGSIQLAGADMDLSLGTVLSTGDISLEGGNVQLLGEQVGLLAGTVNVSGTQGGGNIWLGGNQEGTGPLPNARAVYVAPTVELSADAQDSGSGGNIIIWSEESSRIYGAISATGGSQAGDGGFIETSSRGFLEVTQAPDVSAAQGRAGLWLLDPFDIEIRNNGGNNVNLPAATPFEATGSVAILDIGVLNAGLANGNVVVATTTNGGTAAGNITLIDPLVYSAQPGATLELLAAGDIRVQASITPGDTSGPLNLQLRADTDNQGNGVVEIASNVLVDTSGGALLLQGNGEQTVSAAGVSLLANSSLQTRGGNITIAGRHSNNSGVLVGANTSIDTAGTAGNGAIAINGVSQTGIGIDLGGTLTISDQLTLDGQTGSSTQPAVRSTFALMDNRVLVNAVGNVELDSIQAATEIDITTDGLLRVTGTNSAGQSLVTTANNGNIRIRHGGGGQTPFVVGNAAVNGTAGAIATSTNNAITPVRSFLDSFSQGNISIVTAGSTNPNDCVNDCNDFDDDDFDDDFGDNDFGDDGALDDSSSPLSIAGDEDGDDVQDNNDFDDDFEDDDFDDDDFDDDDFDDGDFEDDDSEETADSDDAEDEDDDENDDSDFDDDEFAYGDDFSVDVLEDAEITAEKLDGKEKVLTQEYSQYLGVESEPNLPLPEVQQKLGQVAIETGYTPGIVYIDFVPDDRAQTKQVLELNQDNYLLELVLVTQNGPPQRLLIDTTKADVQNIVARFHRGVTNVTFGRRYLRSAQKLHNWLISPLESALSEQEISHLSFVLPSGLRSLPLAALHDGETFLIERYSLGIMPSVGLTNIDYSDIRPAEVLAAGASTFLEQPALPAVPLELRTIADTLWPGRFFLNESFTLEQLLANRQSGDYDILHLATHGEFRAGNPSNSYIQLWDQRLTLDQLSRLSLDNPPVDLLVLSACRTALGSREAELGFAGLAVKAGVKTAMASLWRVDDVGTAGLMTEFYSNLRTSTMRAEALRQAQLAMLRGNVSVDAGQLVWTGGTLVMPPILADETGLVLSHPFYWAAFTLVGSPW